MVIPESCPGSKSVKQPYPEEKICPGCQTEVEIWSDELCTECPNCKRLISKEETPSCIEWCAFAEKCIGEEAFKRLKKKSES